jgi:preprotein translocase subunit SecB
MQRSPLQLDGYFLKELHFTLSDELGTPTTKRLAYSRHAVKIEAETSLYTGNPREWRCQLSVESQDEKEKEQPYNFRVTYIGFFSVSDNYPEDKVELLAKTNAPALLYSAARELLVSLTARGSAPPLLLPSITFIEAPSVVKAKPSAKGETKKIKSHKKVRDE